MQSLMPAWILCHNAIALTTCLPVFISIMFMCSSHFSGCEWILSGIALVCTRDIKNYGWRSI